MFLVLRPSFFAASSPFVAYHVDEASYPARKGIQMVTEMTTKKAGKLHRDVQCASTRGKRYKELSKVESACFMTCMLTAYLLKKSPDIGAYAFTVKLASSRYEHIPHEERSRRLYDDFRRCLRPHLGETFLLTATVETRGKSGRKVDPHLHGVLFCREHQIEIIKRRMLKFSSLPSASRARAVDLSRLKSVEDALRWTAYWTKARGKLHRTQDLTKAGRIMWENKRIRGLWRHMTPRSLGF